jgi:hypothetical protein
MLTVLGVWVASSVAVVGMAVSNMIVTFAGSALLLLTMVVSSMMGFGSIVAELQSIPLFKKIAALVFSDWVKALLVLAGWPVAIGYAMLSVVNQLVRRVTLGCGCAGEDRREALGYGPEERGRWLTHAAHLQFASMRRWRWSSVLVKIIWWGAGFLSIVVIVGKVVTVFLAWLIGAVSELSFLAVLVIFVFIGLFMFLLPPVPGVPVYLAGGVIVTDAAQKQGGLDFWPAVALTVGVCLGIKMLAIVCQQKLIGERMSSSVWVRKTVAINSTTIRAIQRILEAPGILRFRKVCILCGGPDWPTSVLTGILRLSLAEMLLGSVPVVLLIAPCCAAGGLLLRRQDGGVWEAAAGVTLSVAAMAQSLAMILACYYIEQIAEQYKEELEAMQDDLEVEALERREKAKQAEYNAATDWHAPHFPFLCRTLLSVSALAMALACYGVQFASQNCFQTFSVTDKIEVRLGGNVLNLVKGPWGWLALAMAAGSVLCLQVFRCWATRKVGRFSEAESAAIAQLAATPGSMNSGGRETDYGSAPYSISAAGEPPMLDTREDSVAHL